MVVVFVVSAYTNVIHIICQNFKNHIMVNAD